MNSLRGESFSCNNVDFCADTTIVSAELERVGGYKTSLEQLHFNVLKAASSSLPRYVKRRMHIDMAPFSVRAETNLIYSKKPNQSLHLLSA